MFAGSILPKTTVFSSSVALPCVRNNIRSIKPCRIVCQADNNNNGNPKKNGSKGLGIGDLLGPIGLTIAKTIDREEHVDSQAGAQLLQRAADAAGVSLGPIGLTIGSDLTTANEDSQDDYTDPESIATLSTEEWRSKYEQDGYVDLWVEEEFNSGSRLIGGRAVHFGGHAGQKSGEGPGESTAPRHKVKIFNKFIDQEIEVEVPEDKYILYEAEDQGLVLPYACRLGCCTACAVKVLDGELYQPQSLGISAALKERGYALMCVGYPLTDLVLETVDEDEIYDLQFGKNFEEQATDPNSASVLRDDYAIELALLDE